MLKDEDKKNELAEALGSIAEQADKPEKPQTSMLDDILATDAEVATVPAQVGTIAYDDSELAPQPLDLNRLNAADFSVIISTLMHDLGLTSLVMTEEDRATALAVPEGQAMVLAAKIDSEGTLYLDILTGPESEFRK